MIATIRNHIFRQPENKDRRVVTATATASTRVRTATGEWINLAPGESAEVLESDAAQSANLRYVRAADPDALTPRDLVPKPREERPLPECWAELPKCFSKYHELSDRLAIAIDHVLDIRAALRRHFPAACPEDVSSISYAQIGAADFLRPVGHRGPQELATGKTWAHGRTIELNATARREFEALNRAEREAWEKASDLRDRTQEPMTNAYLECARHRTRMHGDRAKLTRELNDTAYELFCTRIGALGLHESENRRLFRGSADFHRYVREVPTLHGLKHLGAGQTIVIDQVDSLATYARQDAAATAELTELLAEAKRELKRASKAA